MIKNRTSVVTVSKSITKIEDCLVAHGAKDILKTYVDGRPNGLAFIINIGESSVPFKIPSRVDRIVSKMTEKRKRLRKGSIDKITQQAERTAWKILSDWVEIQMTIVDLDQAEIMEVFMPYIYDRSKEQTFFDKAKQNNFSMMLEHKK
jgi:hypothetical protein